MTNKKQKTDFLDDITNDITLEDIYINFKNMMNVAGLQLLLKSKNKDNEINDINIIVDELISITNKIGRLKEFIELEYNVLLVWLVA